MDIAIVLGSKGVNATGLIRSLGMASINVVYASTYSKIESKYVWKYLKLPEDKKKWVNILNKYKILLLILLFPDYSYCVLRRFQEMDC